MVYSFNFNLVLWKLYIYWKQGNNSYIQTKQENNNKNNTFKLS